MGHRAGLDRCGKSRPTPGFDPRTVQPVASRYTGYATRPTQCGVETQIIIGLRYIETYYLWQAQYMISGVEM